MKIMVAVSVVLLLWPCRGVRGQDERAKTSRQLATASAAEDAENTEEAETLDSQLLEGIGGDTSESEPAASGKVEAERPGERAEVEMGRELSAAGSDIGQPNVLVRIGRRMLRVEKLLIDRDVSDKTQRNQREIVAELDRLIASLSRSQATRRQDKMQKGAKDQQPGQKKSTRVGNKAARNSSGKPEQADSTPRDPADLQKTIGEIWGHLPERLRGQIRSVEAVRFLPKYRKLIEDYYRRLAEEG